VSGARDILLKESKEDGEETQEEATHIHPCHPIHNTTVQTDELFPILILILTGRETNLSNCAVSVI